MLNSIMKRLVAKPVEDDRPRLADLHRTAKSMGLDPKEIARIYKGSQLTGIRAFLSKYWWALLFAAVISVGVILAVVTGASPVNASGQTGPPPSQYPTGTRYGVISVKDFRRGHFRQETKGSSL